MGESVERTVVGDRTREEHGAPSSRPNLLRERDMVEATQDPEAGRTPQNSPQLPKAADPPVGTELAD